MYTIVGKTRLRKNPAITLLVIYQAPNYFQDFSSYVNPFIKYTYTGRDNFQLKFMHRDCRWHNCNMYSAGHDMLTLDKENKICSLYFWERMKIPCGVFLCFTCTQFHYYSSRLVIRLILCRSRKYQCLHQGWSLEILREWGSRGGYSLIWDI